MRKNIHRGMGAAMLAGAVVLGVAAPAAATTSTAASAPADNGGVSVVDPPDTSGLNNIWTFDPLGVPVLGLVQSIAQAPNRLL